MRKTLFILLAAIIVTVNSSRFPPLHDSECGFTRSDALACTMKYGDLNHDNKLTADELDHALKTLVPWYLKPLKWIGGVTAARTMKDCDYNGDGVLTPRDWKLSAETCMPTQENLCAYKWFCDRAKLK